MTSSRLLWASLASLLPLWTSLAPAVGARHVARADNVTWTPCGDGFECTNVTVPLNWRSSSDNRTAMIAVTRFPAPDKSNRRGSVYLNPGGPGGSGTSLIRSAGTLLSAVLEGQYDMIGFDPRGIALSRPYVSCFDSLLDEHAFGLQVNNLLLDLPANMSNYPGSASELKWSLTKINSAIASLAQKCHAKTGDALGFFGTEAVVRDIDYMSKVIDGEDAAINFWGFSYGSDIGQNLVKILDPSRIGHVIIDGILDSQVFTDYPTKIVKASIIDFDHIFETFASTCIDAGANCSLNAFNFSSSNDLLHKIEDNMNSLYEAPAPVFGLPYQSIATAADMRYAIGNAMYSISNWPVLADALVLALQGNYTALIAANNQSLISASDAKKPDDSLYAFEVVTCNDAKPFEQPPTMDDYTQVLLDSLNASRWGGDLTFQGMFCSTWLQQGLVQNSRYNGTFELSNGTLHLPVLVLSNQFDPVTPLANAEAALARLGDNARLIEQPNGYGHTVTSDISFCTFGAIRAYMLNGTVPTEQHSFCDVDQKPWQSFDLPDGLTRRADDPEWDAKQAWREFGKVHTFGRPQRR